MSPEFRCQLRQVEPQQLIGGALVAGRERASDEVSAVANHVASFAESTRLLTMLGSIDSHEDFIREKLVNGVEPEFLTMPGSPTIS